ncbi:MAG: exonuclease [Polyangiaceae bacterium]|nr:exonuclease [Polyangiaceae bacterium]
MPHAVISPEDAYFSADVETDGPIPGPYSMLSFALVYAGRFDGSSLHRPADYRTYFTAELRPISDAFEVEALRVNGLDRARLVREGSAPEAAMTAAADWVRVVAGNATPVFVAYPMSFDWLWLYWYFVRFSASRSPFSHSRCFDVKTAYAAKARVVVSAAGRSHLPPELRSPKPHTHNSVDDAIEQAEIFANVFEWEGPHDSQRVPGAKTSK